jgi:hypothetical protein
MKAFTFINEQDDVPKHFSSAELKAKGIVVCDQCGRLCSLDYKYCSKCQRKIIILFNPKTPPK